jgi:hypothetical protein
MNRVGVPLTSPDACLARDVPSDPPHDVGAGSIAVEAWDVEPELGGVPFQVAVFERLLER